MSRTIRRKGDKERATIGHRRRSFPFQKDFPHPDKELRRYERKGEGQDDEEEAEVSKILEDMGHL